MQSNIAATGVSPRQRAPYWQLASLLPAICERVWAPSRGQQFFDFKLTF